MEVKQRKRPHQYEMKTRVNDARTLDKVLEFKLQQQQQRSVPKSLHQSEQSFREQQQQQF